MLSIGIYCHKHDKELFRNNDGVGCVDCFQKDRGLKPKGLPDLDKT